MKQMLFLLANFGVFFIMGHMCEHTFIVMKEFQNRAKHHELPQIADLRFSIVIMLAILYLRYVFTHILCRPLGEIVIRKDKWDTLVRKQKIEKFGASCFKLLFFVCTSVYGWTMFNRQSWFPVVMGGKGDVMKCYINCPYLEKTPGLRLYYVISLGYHMHSFVKVMFERQRNDFHEMLLHHTVTVSLLLFSYISGFSRIGVLISLIHDVSDISVYAVKASTDTKYTRFTLILYLNLLFNFGFCRLYVFPFVLYSSVVSYSSVVNVGLVRIIHFFIGMLSVLLVLHVYWYSLFLKMGYLYATRGKIEDIQQKIKKDKYA